MGWSGIKEYGFGKRDIEKDNEIRKMGLEARKGKPRIWTDEKIAEFIDELLTLYKKVLLDDKKIEEGNPRRLKQETIMDMNTMINRLLQFKEHYYPTPTKNININIDMTADKVVERLKEWKKKKLEEMKGGESENELENN